MTDITIGKAQKMTAPAPFGLVSTIKPDGTTNLMAVSWWTYLSNHPATIGVCLSQKGLSGQLIRDSGVFALNLVGEELSSAALQCGRCSGRTVNKAQEFGIDLEPASKIEPETVKNSRVVFECKLTGIHEVCDHTLYVGEVIAVRGDESVNQLFAYDGYGRLDTIK